MDEEKMARAKQALDTLCAALDAEDWNYQKDEEKLEMTCTVQGEDLPMEISVRMVPKQQIALLMSEMPFRVPEDKLVEMAVAVTIANDSLVDGSFDYDIRSGRIWFRLTSSFMDSQVSMEMFTYMVYCSCQTVDEFNDKFLMIAKGAMSANDLLPND